LITAVSTPFFWKNSAISCGTSEPAFCSASRMLGMKKLRYGRQGSMTESHLPVVSHVTSMEVRSLINSSIVDARTISGDNISEYKIKGAEGTR
jgi:hypothetical protein